MSIREQLTEILATSGHGPFLFIGSGFSRRYANLGDWENLLRLFCKNINDFEYYHSKADSDLPLTAKLISEDYAEFWWKSKEMESERLKFKTQVNTPASPLKISISEHVKSLSTDKIDEDNDYFSEIEVLKNANIDGIITTNWDLLLENLFPDYVSYIGQEELVAATTQNINEIYKIHGCSTNPNSIVLTSDDYKDFEEKNPYLAAKLVTIFVENPVIFIGYSLSDPNIKMLLSSIVKGIGKKNIEKIRKNLIFVQREGKSRSKGIHTAIFSLGDSDLQVTLAITDDFSEIYKSLQDVQHKIPVRVLRRCKQQMYDLVKGTEPSSQLCVVDFENIDDSSVVDYVVGVGIKDRISPIGYQPITLPDIFKDVIQDSPKYNPKEMLTTTIPSLQHMSKYIPVYKYLSMCNIHSLTEYTDSEYKSRSVDDFTKKDYRVRGSVNFFRKECNGLSVSDIIEKFEPTRAAMLIPFIHWKDIDIEPLYSFVLQHIDMVDGANTKYPTYFRKLICVYDAISNGYHTS